MSAALRLGLLLLPALCPAQAPEVIAVPLLPRASPPPSDVELAPLLAQLKSGDEVARTRAMLRLGNFNLSPEQAREIVPLLIPILRQWPAKPYRAGSLSAQSAALIALWGVGPEGRRALPEVGAAIDFDEMGIRDTAMNAVSRMRIRGADAAIVMPAVVRLLEFQPVTSGDKERYPGARENAVRWLGEIGPAARPALPALIRLADESPPDLRIFVYRAIGNIGPAGADAVPTLLKILEQEEDGSALQYLAQAIAQVGLHDPRLRDPLLAIWRRNLELLPTEEPPRDMGSTSSLKLRWLNGLVSWQRSTDPTVVRAVIQAVSAAPEWALNYSGVDGSGPSPGPIGSRALGNMAEAFLKTLGPQPADVTSDLAALVRRSADRPNARRLAFVGLQKLEAVPDEFLPLLIDRMEQVKEPTGASAYWAYPALESMGPRAAPAIPQLRAKLREGNPTEKSGAARILAAIGRPAAVEAIPDLAEAATTVVRGDSGSWALSLFQTMLKLDPASQAGRDGIDRIIANASDAAARIEGHRTLLALGSDSASHRAALTAIMSGNDQWGALAATALVRDAGAPTTRAAAIDRLFQLLDPFVTATANPPPGRSRSGSQPAAVDFSTTYAAVVGLEALLPADVATQPRLADLVRTLWVADKRNREEPPLTNREPEVRFLMLIRILTLFETKTPSTQVLLAELSRDPQFLIREAASGRVNNGR